MDVEIPLERGLELLDTLPEEPLHARLSARHLVGRSLEAHAARLEAARDFEGAAKIRGILAEHTRTRRPDGPRLLGEEGAYRLVFCLEGAGRVAEAARWALHERTRRTPPTLAFDRAGRRLARRAGIPWPPDLPLQEAPERAVPLRSCPSTGRRPLYEVDGRLLPVEEALVAWLGTLGRHALHVENAPWTTLFALLFHDVLFLPIPGALPIPGLRGPLDLGTPSFYTRRAEAIEARLEEIRAGQALGMLQERDPTHRGEDLAGASWSLSPEVLEAIVSGITPDAQATLLGRIAREGWGASAGLPDLVVLPGPEIRLEGAIPARIGPGLLLAEVKGPTDSLRDEQRVWLDLLCRAGVKAEVWHVR